MTDQRNRDATRLGVGINAIPLRERERRLVAVGELMPERMTFRAMADALAERYPDLNPVSHTTVARDVNVLLNRFQAESRQVAGKSLMADLGTLDADERRINEVVAKMLVELLPEKGVPLMPVVDRFVKLLDSKRKILEHRAKLLGLDSLPEDERERAGAGALRLSDSERIDGIMELFERARARRDTQNAPSLSN